MPWDEHDSQLWEGFSGRIEEKPSVVNESAQREFNRLHAEISRLRALVEQAYQEGWQRGDSATRTVDESWLTSCARVALKGAEES